jgi:single-strand DNA-binding protein
MKSMNKVQLIGYLGNDPEFRTAKNGTPMARMRMATNHWYIPKEGETKQFTQWHTIRVWGARQVDKLRDYLTKGNHIMVEGKLVYRKFTDKLGVTHYHTEICAEMLVDLDR